MNWHRVNQYYWQADAAYRIAKSKTRGEVRYTGFHVPAGVQQCADSASFDSIDCAAAWCDQHYNEVKQNAA